MTLFRPEVFQAKKNRWIGQIVLVRPFSLQFLTFCAVALATVLIAFLIFGSYTNKTTVTGQLLPTTGVVRVYSQDMGIIAHQHVMVISWKKAIFYLHYLLHEMTIMAAFKRDYLLKLN